jgi:inosose dehydratase
MFVEPEAGIVDFVALRDALADAAYEGPAIVEQDLYPCPVDKPLPIATRTYNYLTRVGFV